MEIFYFIENFWTLDDRCKKSAQSRCEIEHFVCVFLVLSFCLFDIFKMTESDPHLSL